jgi:hypothetical protein
MMPTTADYANALTNYTNDANQTYNTDTTNAANAQTAANAANANVNSEGQLANQSAAALGALGATDSNQAQNQANFMTAEKQQLDTMGFDPTTLNQANQNIAQETGQLGAAQNQMGAAGGTRGFNAVGAENRQTDVQSQANKAIAANTAVQSNALGQANAAGTFTGQDATYLLGQNTNAINAYSGQATSQNQTMATYANQLNTLSQQAVAQGGLVGSNIQAIMTGANQAAQGMLAPSTQALQQAQAYQATETGVNQAAQAGLTDQQIAYNTQLDSFNESAQKLVTANNQAAKIQINKLQASVNNEKATEINTSYENGNYTNPLDSWLFNMFTNSPDDQNAATNAKISSQQAQIKQLETTGPGGMQANIL